MKKSLQLLSLGLATQLLFSCLDLPKFEEPKKEETKEDVRTVTIKNEYQMSIPVYMKEAKTLHDDASLQYSNIYKEVYIIVIDENKDTVVDKLKELEVYNKDSSVIKNYRDTQINYFMERTEVKSAFTSTPILINNQKAELVEFRAKVEDIKMDISYFCAFIEGEERLYMVMGWTLSERKDKYRNVFIDMFHSFKSIKKSNTEAKGT